MQTKAMQVYKILKKEYGQVKTTLEYENDFQLVISAILSANANDMTVNKVTKILFKKFPTARKLADAKLAEIEKIIRPVGLYKQKAKYIKRVARILSNKKIPDNINDLIKLPGVGRKVANVILYNVYRKNEGVVVDTHVKRLSFRIGLTEEKNPVKIEKELMKQLPKNVWGEFSLLLIKHGREICQAKKPRCEICVLNRICEKNGL